MSAWNASHMVTFYDESSRQIGDSASVFLLERIQEGPPFFIQRINMKMSTSEEGVRELLLKLHHVDCMSVHLQSMTENISALPTLEILRGVYITSLWCEYDDVAPNATLSLVSTQRHIGTYIVANGASQTSPFVVMSTKKPPKKRAASWHRDGF